MRFINALENWLFHAVHRMSSFPCLWWRQNSVPRLSPYSGGVGRVRNTHHVTIALQTFVRCQEYFNVCGIQCIVDVEPVLQLLVLIWIFDIDKDFLSSCCCSWSSLYSPFLQRKHPLVSRRALSDSTLWGESCLFCQGLSPLIVWTISFSTPCTHIYTYIRYQKCSTRWKKSSSQRSLNWCFYYWTMKTLQISTI